MTAQNNIICINSEVNAACGSTVCIKNTRNMLYWFLGQFLVEIKIIKVELKVNDYLFPSLNF